MSDDDNDPEAQGVDALRLLKQGSHVLARPKELSGALPSSIPLVALLPPQKRSRSISQDLSEQPRPSGSQKIQQGHVAGIARQASLEREKWDKEIRQHKSAPEQCLDLSKELRSCRSAPDLRLPALAAIRGLQNGTLQVDRHTRMKIAAAAKRVLEARELKKRSGQEREPQSRYPYPRTDPVSPMALKSQSLWDPPSQCLTPSGTRAEDSRADGSGSGKSSDGSGQPGCVPGSLETAAAIAQGQSPSAAAKANFHRPALGTVSQGGALLSMSHRPFTVTTGVPRFATDASFLSSEEQSAPIMCSTPLKDAPQDFATGRPSNSKILFAEDIFKTTTDSH